MNRKQIIVLWIGIAAIVIMGIFPPWILNAEGASLMIQTQREISELSNQNFHTYHFILSGPRVKNVSFLLRVDLPKLSVQWITVAAITGGLLVTFRDKKKD